MSETGHKRIDMFRPRNVDPVNFEDFDPKKEYTAEQLEAFATALLKKDRADLKSQGREDETKGILFDEQWYTKKKREVSVDALDIDGTLTNSMQEGLRPGVFKGDGQRMYNRVHPTKGRKTNDRIARKEKGASFYKN
jgi:hypothetical protein